MPHQQEAEGQNEANAEFIPGIV
ncbi:MAG: hypothetical protein K0R10_663, partial [Alphaproteobacteria bacterium]|nr:hypothetical protein [Alphaproteobacteria bacterium]